MLLWVSKDNLQTLCRDYISSKTDNMFTLYLIGFTLLIYYLLLCGCTPIIKKELSPQLLQFSSIDARH